MIKFAKIKFVTKIDSGNEECCVEAWAWDEPSSVAANAAPDRKSRGYGKTLAEAQTAAAKAAQNDYREYMIRI
jgi:hypothetical protein